MTGVILTWGSEWAWPVMLGALIALELIGTSRWWT